VPLIVYDPRPEADSTRGMVTDKLVEGIDLAPTFLEAFGGPSLPHILEGLSLQPILHNLECEWRTFCVSEYDYSTRDARRAVQIDQKDARLVMVFDGRWKLTHVENMRPMLFDLEVDPKELNDLGNNPDHKGQIARLSVLHFEWARRHHNRITRTAEVVEKMADNKEPAGVMIGYWNPEELKPSGRKLPNHVDK
jgi:arylsulfatase A-like enzyme